MKTLPDVPLDAFDRRRFFELQLRESFEEMRKLTVELYGTRTMLKDAQHKLFTRKQEILLKYADNPKDLGSNAETREANLANMTQAEKETVHNLMQEESDISFDLSQAREYYNFVQKIVALYVDIPADVVDVAVADGTA